MDAESAEVLRGLAERWRSRADEWISQKTEERRTAEGRASLQADIEMLGRHIKALDCIHTVLAELSTVKDQLTRLQGHEDAVRVVEERLMAMRCYSEEFFVRYLRCKGDYRLPLESLPLPYGWKCHRQYRKELEGLKERMRRLEAETQEKRDLLGGGGLLQGPEERALMTQINTSMNQHQSLQVDLYQLLVNVEPIDAAAFHGKCGALIDAKMLLLEGKRMAQMAALPE